MKKNEHLLSTPTRQSYVAILLILFKFIRILVRAGWPLLLVLFLRSEGNTFNTYITIVGLVISFLSLIGSLLAYFKYHFFIKDEELYIEKGVIRKTKLNIPFERIQTINFEQNLIHQFFNVVSVKVDTAGSSASEFNIDAISKEEAHFLRDYIMTIKQEKAPLETHTVEEEEVNNATTNQKQIFNLDIGDLIKIGVSENHLRTAAIIMFFFFGLLDNIEDALNKKIEVIYKENIGIKIEHWLSVLLFTVIFFILVSFVITLVRTVIRYYNLTLWETSNGYKVQSGLFTRREDSVLKEKIQMLKWKSNPFQRIFGIHHLQMLQASSIVARAKGSINVPGCYDKQIDLLKEDNFPAKDLVHFKEHGISPLVIGRYTLYYGVLPGVLITLGAYAKSGNTGLLFLLWIPICYLLARVFQSNWKWKVNEEILQTHKGILSYDQHIFQLYKVQSIALVQSIYQRRKQLANVVIYTAAGKLTIPYIKLDLAKDLRNYILYKVESDKREWM